MKCMNLMNTNVKIHTYPEIHAIYEGYANPETHENWDMQNLNSCKFGYEYKYWTPCNVENACLSGNRCKLG